MNPCLLELKTDRLKLRQWIDDDLSQFALINADPEVMKYFPSILTAQESDGLAQRIRNLIDEHGWGFWAVEKLDDNKFIGFVGLNRPNYALPVTSCVEIGWRLGVEHWGKGYATEAAKASLSFAFEELCLDEVYSFTPVINKNSRAVMERLGMFDTQQNFSHPMVPVESPLCEHVLYKITSEKWSER